MPSSDLRCERIPFAEAIKAAPGDEEVCSHHSSKPAYTSGRDGDDTTAASSAKSKASTVAQSQNAEGHLNIYDSRFDVTSIRHRPEILSSFLRSGARFTGKQQSGRSVYDVSVLLLNVNVETSSLCGYLSIQGLTEDQRSLTTYFEGEIIGPQHSFLTRRSDWGSSEKVDLQHWARFGAFKALSKQAIQHGYMLPSILDQSHVFMRWKELCIVKNDWDDLVAGLESGRLGRPSMSRASRSGVGGSSSSGPFRTRESVYRSIVDDQMEDGIGGMQQHPGNEEDDDWEASGGSHDGGSMAFSSLPYLGTRARTSQRPSSATAGLEGISYAGFYYICFDQSTGSIQGLYYHKNSEMFQQLYLKHVPTLWFPVCEPR